MSKMNFSPTRFYLLNLQKQLQSAIQGHFILKEKQTGLTQNFVTIIQEAKILRKKTEKNMTQAFSDFLSASSLMSPAQMANALAFPKATATLEVTTKNIFSVKIPQLHLHQNGKVLTYGFTETTSELDSALMAFQKNLPILVKLAELEKSAEILALELEQIRRRVNALEHLLIPKLKTEITSLLFKLEEREQRAIGIKLQMKKRLQQSK